MHKRVIGTFLLLIFFCSNLAVHAQTDMVGDKRGDINIVWGMAQDTFGEIIDRPIPGIMFSFGGRTPNLPLILSTEIGWMNYGFDNHLELRYSNSSDTPGLSVVNIETNNSILMTHLVARVVPFEGSITPYIDGLVGFKYLSTRINIESEAIVDGDTIIIVDGNRIGTSSTFNSFAMSYGVGAGLSIPFFKGQLGLQHSNSRISLQLGVRYLFGTEADYLTEDSIQPENDRIIFEQVQTDTDMLLPKVGFTVGF